MRFSVAFVRALLPNGEFPHANGFAWERVTHFKLEAGVLQPYNDHDEVLPGPGLALAEQPML